MRFGILSIIILILSNISLTAQTIIPGSTINGDIWTIENSPYIITGNIVVEDLTIQPGVFIKFAGNFTFDINTRLQAEGFYSDSIYFQNDSTNTNGWKGLKFRAGASASSISYCIIEGANNQGIKVDQSKPTISNCQIVHNFGDGLQLKDSQIQITHCMIKHNEVNGIILDAGQITATNSIIADNIEAGLFSTNNNDSIKLTNTVIADNQGTGIDGGSAGLIIKNSIIYYNSDGILSSNPGVEVTYSDVQGSTIYPGIGNKNLPPLFEDSSTYTLTDQSPCIDEGDSLDIYNDRYFPPSKGTVHNDMGAYGGPKANGWYPPLYIKPQSVDFGKVTIDSSKSFITKILNYRDKGITVTDIFFEGNDSTIFTSNVQFFYLPFPDSTELIITFQPTHEQEYLARLILLTSEFGWVSIPLSGQGVVSEIDPLESELDFEYVSVGDSVILDLPILNLGSDTLRVQALQPVNPVFNLHETFLKIDPDSSIDTLWVTFRPDSPKAYQDSLILLSNDPDEQRIAVSLEGEGLSPVIHFIPESLDFGSVILFADTLVDLGISNIGNDTLIIDSLLISQPDSGTIVFQISDTTITYPGEIPPDSSLFLSIRFEPMRTGILAGQIHIFSNDPYQEEAIVSLVGTGIAPELILSSIQLNFGQVPLSSDSAQFLHIHNSGSADLIIYQDSLTITGTDSDAFTLEGVNTDITINPGDTEIVAIRFYSNQLDTNRAQLRMISNDPFQREVTVELIGIGTAPGLVLSSLELNYGLVPLYSDSLNLLTLYNTGLAELIIYQDSLSISGHDANAFQIVDVNDDIILQPGDSAEITIRFHPNQVGPKQAVLKLISNDPYNRSQLIMLAGLAIDNEAASIAFDPINSSNPFIDNEVATITFVIFSFSPVDSALLLFRTGGKSNFIKTALYHISENLWSTQLDSPLVTERGLEYFVQAYHGWTSTLYPEEGETKPNCISVQVPYLQYPEKTKKEIYQMISIPIITNGQNLNELFSDNLGAYDNTKYRVFDYTNGLDYTEISGMDEALPPGKAIWLITKEPVDLDISNGQSVLTNQEFILQLNKGWNMIASPFAFPIDWNEVSNKYALRFYDGTDWPFVSVLEPFKGYAVNVLQDTTISIPPREIQSLIQLPKSGNPPQGDSWHIQITANTGRLKDNFNYAGAQISATNRIDQYDYAEPPPIGDYIALYLRTENHSGYYSTDYRKTGASGYTYHFELKSNINGQKSIQLYAENLPQNFDWTVLSKETKINYAKNIIRTKTNHGRYELIVGTKDYIAGAISGYNELPHTFNIQQNYPNPFNPNTFIKFQLPHQDRVTIKIYDILGRHIKTLLDQEMREAGYYQVRWNGTNFSNTHVSSGIYFLRLQTSQYHRSIKMILQR